MSEWAEREAEIREILSGNANPSAVRVEAAAYDLPTPADLAAQVRAQHRAEALREAADLSDDQMGHEYVATWLRDLADKERP